MCVHPIFVHLLVPFALVLSIIVCVVVVNIIPSSLFFIIYLSFIIYQSNHNCVQFTTYNRSFIICGHWHQVPSVQDEGFLHFKIW